MKIQKNDGGYYALKGYMFQFDKTLIEIFDNQHKKVELEQIQDIGHDPYYIQVKHKEAKTYSHSLIKPAVLQLLEEFEVNSKKKFILYCYFADKNEVKWRLAESDLKKILGDKLNKFSALVVNGFLVNFFVIFAPNFELQFTRLIDKIKDTYSLTTIDHAIIYHSIFRSYLLKTAINTNRSKRVASKAQFDIVLENTERIILSAGYLKYLGEKKYNALVRNKYFAPKSINKDHLSRIFILDSSFKNSSVNIIKIITKIIKRFYKKNKSSFPIICIRNSNEVNDIKQRLVDLSIFFSDGTYFNGDKFRIDDLIGKPRSEISIKIISDEYLSEITDKTRIDEIYDFFVDAPINIKNNKVNLYQIHVNDVKQIDDIIN